ncbi:hypothetical protein ElyMa_006506600 [Elysia marginata]|uniref:Uncharacterized protein n=1 Tax=Elysia marginata TaxID=1093978 RepID=A0AAV4I2Z2_9GAST|nr:hypothetical protein ElyMa_006506600 [Elysia marginata]
MAENKRFRKQDSTDSVEEKREDEMMMVIMSKIEKKMEEKMGRIEATLAGFLRETKEMMSEVKEIGRTVKSIEEKVEKHEGILSMETRANGEEVKSVTPRPQPQMTPAPENKKKTKRQLDLRSNCNASVVCWNVHGSIVSKLEWKEFVNKLREQS